MQRPCCRVWPRACLGFLLALLCGIEAAAAPKRSIEKAAIGLTPELLKQHTAALTSGALAERRLGSPGDQASQRYIAEQLEKAGLRPGGDSGFRQPVPLAIARIRSAGPVTFRVIATSFPVSISVPPAELTLFPGASERTVALRDAQLVFVGHGIAAPALSWDDYKGADVRGKVVLLLDGEPQGLAERPGGSARSRYGTFSAKLAEAARRGAAAVLLVYDERTHGVPLAVTRAALAGETVLDPTAPRDGPQLPLRGLLTEDAGRRIVQASGQDWDALRRGAASSSSAPVSLTVRMSVQLSIETRTTESANVVAVLPGTDPVLKREAVLITAHLDGHAPLGGDAQPGARDNALGVASLLAMAQVAAQGPAPKRTMLFAALTAQSNGSIGASRLLLGLVARGLRPVAHINLDTLPTGGESPTVFQIGRGKSTLDLDLEAAAKKEKREVQAAARPELGLFYRSDSARFAEAGVPSLSLVAEDLDRFLREELLRPGDALRETWTLEGAVAETRLLYRAALRIAEAKKPPAFLPGDEYAPEGAREGGAATSSARGSGRGSR